VAPAPAVWLRACALLAAVLLGSVSAPARATERLPAPAAVEATPSVVRQMQDAVQDTWKGGVDWLAGGASEPLVLEQGSASFLWSGLQGRKTASGERYDMNELTAAHKSLPFGTRVIVRSLQTGREVAVRIIDRGPHLKNRIIDLSHAAVAALGIKGKGVSEVQIIEPK
jgi:rare lipoprotein A